MFSYYFNIGLIYFIIGFAAALVFYLFFKKDIIGKFWGALIVGLVGSFLGAVLEYLLYDVIEYLRNINNAVNIFPPIITAFILLWLFSRVNKSN